MFERKKVFVLSDNCEMATFIKALLDESSMVDVDYFCSPVSPLRSSGFDWASPVNLRNNVNVYSGYDVGISCHSKQIFPEELVNSVPCYNIHPGYNPFNKGWYPQVFSIINGFPAGCTIHRMTADIDGGPIVDQSIVPIYSDDISETVYRRVLEKEKELLRLNIDNLIFTSKPLGKLAEDEGNYNSVSDFRALQLIDLDEVVRVGDFINRMRALSHPPYWNAFFVDAEGQKVFLRLEAKKDNQ